MFDIGFSELLLFGVIALIVLGPEKLPQAARTAGQWYAKIRRMVSTLQSEIEAELDLAETRQQMQKELAKIRETEVEMRREMAEMRGSMREFESSQNQNLKGSNQTIDSENHNNELDSNNLGSKQLVNNDYSYDESSIASKDSESVELEKSFAQDEAQEESPNDSSSATNELDTAVMTRPWENMWFRLGDYDQSRRLPAAPYLPNYKADILWHSPEYKGETKR